MVGRMETGSFSCANDWTSNSRWGCEMKVEDANAIIEEHAEFIRANMVPIQQGDGVCIVTPMLNRNNDCMNVYVSESSSGDLVLSDLGETIGAWMMEHDISCVPGPSFNGRSGMPYKFDYAIGQNKRRPMRPIKAVNNPGRRGMQNALFGWEDVKASRIDCEGYVFLNSLNTKDGVVPQESVEACRNYGLNPVIWGRNEEDFISDLAA